MVQYGVDKEMPLLQIRGNAGGWVRDKETGKETELASGSSGVMVTAILMSACHEIDRWKERKSF